MTVLVGGRGTRASSAQHSLAQSPWWNVTCGVEQAEELAACPLGRCLSGAPTLGSAHPHPRSVSERTPPTPGGSPQPLAQLSAHSGGGGVTLMPPAGGCWTPPPLQGPLWEGGVGPGPPTGSTCFQPRESSSQDPSRAGGRKVQPSEMVKPWPEPPPTRRPPPLPGAGWHPVLFA